MQKKQVKLRWLMGGVCVTALCLVIILSFSSSEPRYNGHRLYYWFNELPLTIVAGGGCFACQQLTVNGRTYGSQKESPSITLRAIQQIGTNGLPFIFSKLQRRDNAVTVWFQNCLRRCGFKRSLFPNPQLERGQAVTALLVLLPLPPSAFSQLSTLSKNNTNAVGLSAGYVLNATTDSNLVDMIARFR
jgi:hypothetical protein